MPRATTGFHQRLALVFDFDRTLAPSSYDVLVEACGLDPEAFRREQVEPLREDGWEKFLAEVYALLRATRREGAPRLTRERIAEVGRGLQTYPGVPEMFDRVRRRARENAADVEVEFYLLSCGLVDLQRALPIAGELTATWGSELHFDERGEADFLKQLVTFPEKVRYLLALAKGLPTSGPTGPADVWREVPPEQMHLPLDQMVYVGDGGSDMPAFSLLHQHGGLAIGVFEGEDPGQWQGYEQMRADRRVQNLAAADFREDSELLRSILLAVESICKLIELRRLGHGE